MEPIPETKRAFDELDAISTDDDMLNALRRASEKVRSIVPACTGLSLALLDHGITLTLVATEEDIQLLDAMQYLDWGPCVKAAEGRRVVMGDTSAMDENGWRLFAAATSAHGIASTLSMPLFEGNAVIGSVNLYAATPHAFDNHHEEVADILGAWAGGAVTNADLSFSTRQDAQRAPQVLDDQRRLDNALGMLSAYTGQSIDEAPTTSNRRRGRRGHPRCRGRCRHSVTRPHQPLTVSPPTAATAPASLGRWVQRPATYRTPLSGCAVVPVIFPPGRARLGTRTNSL